MSRSGRKDGGVAPPIDLGGLFHIPDSDDDENKVEEDNEEREFVNKGENQILNIGKFQLTIRQFAWHQANANQVWPGTFILADFLETRSARYNKSCIELGSATGALTIYLRKLGYEHIITR